MFQRAGTLGCEEPQSLEEFRGATSNRNHRFAALDCRWAKNNLPSETFNLLDR